MENVTALLIPALLAVFVLRLLLLPMKFVTKWAIHGLCGFLCLWLLNSVSGFTGVEFPVNAATVLIAGFLGVPGMGLMTVLELMG